MKTMRLVAITLALAGAGCMDGGILPGIFGGAWTAEEGGGLTVGDVDNTEPTSADSTEPGDSGQPVPSAGTMRAHVRNATDRSATVTIRFLLNDIVVHFARLICEPATTTSIVGPELAQLIEFTGADETGATLSPLVVVFEAGGDNVALYVIADDGDTEPQQPVVDDDQPADGTDEDDQEDQDDSDDEAEEPEEEQEEPGGGGGGGDPVPPPDCNHNGIDDVNDIASGTSEDCNSNLVPDECDLTAGTSGDANFNGVPDECEDCNGNGTADALDISGGTSEDCQPNAIPDECDIALGQGRTVPALRDATGLLFPLDGTYALAMPPNDDSSSAEIALGFSFDFYGTIQNSVFINNNGNLSFGAAYSEYTASGFPIEGFPMVAALWADVDTRDENGSVWFKTQSNALIVTWDDVGYYSTHGDKLNTFQMAISDGLNPIMGVGNNVCFSYGDMQWTTGDASGGDGGFGGTPATVGANQGNGEDFFLIGRFDHEGTDYDGPGGQADGVSYLDGQTVCFNTVTGTTNIDPIPTGFPPDNTIMIDPLLGDVLDLDLLFLSPEPEQTTTVVIDDLDGAAAIGLGIVNTPGNVATVQLNWAPECTDFGLYTLVFTATDDFIPPGESVSSLRIIVACSSGSQDCNSNGVPDECDIAGGTGADCNSNSVPDECDLAGGTSDDLNTNGVPDECEMQQDCNTNGIEDDQDIAGGTSADCNSNSVPDECDIAGGTSSDLNTNAIPDECEGCPYIYDLDGSCYVDAADLGIFAACWLLFEGEEGWDENECADKDFDCSGMVDSADLGLFAEAWQQWDDAVDPADYPDCRPCGAAGIICPWPE